MKTDPAHPDLQSVVIRLVAESLDKEPGSISPEAPLFSTQEGFNSFALMEFLLRLEDAMGLSIPDEDLDPDIFYSVQTIVAYLRNRFELKE